MNDAARVIEDVEEIAIPMQQIQTQMVERTADVPQILTVQRPMDVPMPQVMAQENRGESRGDARAQIVENAFRAFGDDGEVDREEEISQSDAETVKKAMINETSTLLSVVITPTCRLVKRSPRWP